MVLAMNVPICTINIPAAMAIGGEHLLEVDTMSYLVCLSCLVFGGGWLGDGGF